MGTVGDTIINEAAISGQIAKLDKAQVEENEKLIETMVSQDESYKPTNVKSIIAVDKTFLASLIVFKTFPCLTKIFWLISEKFLSIVIVFSDNSII